MASDSGAVRIGDGLADFVRFFQVAAKRDFEPVLPSAKRIALIRFAGLARKVCFGCEVLKATSRC